MNGIISHVGSLPKKEEKPKALEPHAPNGENWFEPKSEIASNSLSPLRKKNTAV